MAFDEQLAGRVRKAMGHGAGVSEKKMFGGLCLLWEGHMVCGITGSDELMVRVGPEQYDRCLAHPHAKEMLFTGRPMKGMIYVSPEGYAADKDLKAWVAKGLAFVKTLPPKEAKAKPKKSATKKAPR
ncbi:MAG: TfoX/Sxy family protein [Deltaproteobacteria bacterium]|nr:TfoX/Sxy family protein [bacterium]MCB9475774.1 TfoX/Sxy family protein [Deltaproteobacteria bacterium]MCB9490326.1 TfoX/Sxy family protein [Deltaproteobacteria bacterium]